MESPRGRVLTVHDNAVPPRAVVEVTASLRCARCEAGKGCGAGILGGDKSLRRVDVLIPRGLDVRQGDKVSIELAPNKLLRASLIVYGLPLCGAIAGAFAAWLSGAGDIGAAFAALAGAGIGVVVGRLRLRRADCLRHFTPTVSARLVPQGHVGD